MNEYGVRGSSAAGPSERRVGILGVPTSGRSPPVASLCSDEVEPRVLRSSKPGSVVWSSLWPSRPRDQVHLELSEVHHETLLRFVLLTPDEPPDQSKTGHLRRRMNQLLFADLRFSYGQ